MTNAGISLAVVIDDSHPLPVKAPLRQYIERNGGDKEGWLDLNGDYEVVHRARRSVGVYGRDPSPVHVLDAVRSPLEVRLLSRRERPRLVRELGPGPMSPGEFPLRAPRLARATGDLRGRCFCMLADLEVPRGGAMAIESNNLDVSEPRAVEQPRGIGRLGDLLAWPPANKSLLMSVVVLGLVLYSTSLLDLAQSNLDRLPFVDPAGLEKQITLSYITMGAWILLALGSLLFLRSHGNSKFFTHAPIQVYSITNAFFAYMFGFFTEPYGFVTLVSGMMVALLLFGRNPTLIGLASWLSVFGMLTVLELLGEIPYAPLLGSSPVIDGRLSLPWALGMGSINVTGGLLAAWLGFYLVGQLRKRDALLVREQSKLVEAVGDLSQTTVDLEDARRKLELRVEERTLAWRAANRDLQVEMEAREKSTVELNNVRLAMEAAIEGVARVGADGRLKSVNAAFSVMHGADAESMIGTPASDWLDAENRAEIATAIQELKPGKKIELNLRGLRVDSSAFAQFIAMVGVPEGEPGEHYRFTRDVTRQQEMSEQLNQAMKMEAIGLLAGGIAHDFNNLLMAILTASEQLQTRFRQSPSATEELEMADMITMAGTRAAALTAQLLDFAHVQPPSLATIDVHQSLRTTLDLLGTALGESIVVETNFCSDSLLTSGDPSRFDSGLLNVALNARDAMPKGGRLVFETRTVTIDRDDAVFAGFQPSEGLYARIDVIDDGSGIDAENIGRIFDPFFTTKHAGKGTGLGLSVFSNCVREMGGALRIVSVPGGGTTCSIYLPITEQPGELDTPLASESDLAGDETILFAEDEDMVARAITMLLTRGGYRVIRCTNGLEAVNLFRDRRDEINLVLLDFRMPVMTGAEAFIELRKLDHQLPVILMSGNLSRPEFKDLKANGLQAILRKPCSRSELLAAVREALVGSRNSKP